MSSESNKRQKVEAEVDDLFEEEAVAPVVTSTKNAAEDGTTEIDSTLKIPEGKKLAYNLGKTNSFKVKITGASHKANVNGPTSVKLTAKLLSLKDKGADIVRAGSMMAIALTKNDKVQTEKGIDA